MPSSSRNEIVLVTYPFTDLSGTKIRPAVVVHAPHPSQDSIVVPLTSQTTSLLAGEFVLKDWAAAGLNVPTAVKRGIGTIDSRLILKSLGRLSPRDASQLDQSLRQWLSL
ncbi:MAG: type II toxin-antitoxin system PemK/MazF family toxin [Anaerolineae bacterium]|nr:type II toxin-antitoxin system PemK/MazF family toxin [Anaerolineae bacterium]